jgi:hypothetical protein
MSEKPAASTLKFIESLPFNRTYQVILAQNTAFLGRLE